MFETIQVWKITFLTELRNGDKAFGDIGLKLLGKRAWRLFFSLASQRDSHSWLKSPARRGHSPGDCIKLPLRGSKSCCEKVALLFPSLGRDRRDGQCDCSVAFHGRHSVAIQGHNSELHAKKSSCIFNCISNQNI